MVHGVYAQTLHDEYYIRNYACYRCSVACGQVGEVKEVILPDRSPARNMRASVCSDHPVQSMIWLR